MWFFIRISFKNNSIRLKNGVSNNKLKKWQDIQDQELELVVDLEKQF